MKKIAVVLLQMDIAFGNPKENQRHVRERFQEANLQPGELVVLPEMWNTAYDLTRLEEIADYNGQETLQLLKELATTYRVTIVGGSVAVKEGADFYNRTYVIDENGSVLTQYDKAHLFGLMAEDRYLASGNKLAFFKNNQVTISPFICYDLRFPEWYRLAAQQGAEVYIVSAQWPVQRLAQWRKLLQARAIENQAFFIAVNRVGADPANHFPGHSMIIDPLGEIILELDDQECIARGEVDAAAILPVRGEIPVFKDARPTLYEQIRKGETNNGIFD